MKTEGFEDKFLGSAFDNLVERGNLANGFLAKTRNLGGFGLKMQKRTIEWSDISHSPHPLPLFFFLLVLL